jgi:thiol:disulfide interchange protein DsbD
MLAVLFMPQLSQSHAPNESRIYADVTIGGAKLAARVLGMIAVIQTMRTFSTMLVLLAPLLPAVTPHAATPDENHVAVTLVSEQSALVPGKTAWFGIRFKHEPQWHTYWVNPGDSGLPTKLSWTVPYGFRPGEIAWPAPTRFDVGGLFNFGYGGDDVLLPVPMGVSSDAVAGSRAHISVAAKWLVCHEECVPGKATLALDLPIAAIAAPNPRWTKAFAIARGSQPQPAAWTGQARIVGDHVEVLVQGADLPPVAELDAFTPQMRVLANAPPQVARVDDALKLTFAKNDYFAAPPATLDLVLASGAQPRHAWSITVPLAAAPDDAPAKPKDNP